VAAVVTTTDRAGARPATPYRPVTGRPLAPRPGRSTVRVLVLRGPVPRVLVPRGPVVRLYGRQHIDLQRVAGALCSR
jgi:hypothetical protein